MKGVIFMGLLAIFAGIFLVSACIGLASWTVMTYFNKDWQEALCTAASAFCGFSGAFCIIYGIILTAHV